MRWLCASVTLLMVPATSATSASQDATRQSALADFPGTTVQYYEVTGDDVTSINRSIRAQRGAGSDGRTSPATTSWTITADYQRETVSGQCKITGARAAVDAIVELPRLAGGYKLGKTERERWDDYTGLLEQGSMATLAFVYENLGQVEAVIASSDCANAKAAGETAIAELRRHADQISAAQEKKLAQLNQFDPAQLTQSKVICRDLLVTGGRLRTVRACLAAREWNRMWRQSSELSQQIVAKFSKSPREPF